MLAPVVNFAKSQEDEKWTSKKYEKLRIGFGEPKASRKDKT
jgi:hypothetical protein